MRKNPTEAKNHPYCYIVPAIFCASLLATAATTYGFFTLVNANDGLFWPEFRQDCLAAWTAVFCLCFALGIGAIISKWNLGKVRQSLAKSARKKLVFLCISGLGLYLTLTQVATFTFPLVPDEYCAKLQSQMFAAGQLTGIIPSELYKSVFSTTMVRDFTVFSQKSGTFSPTYWPGYALLMTPFSFLGIPWACNSFITALSLCFFFLVGRRLGGTNEAGFWAAIFALVSSVVAINAATFYSMPAHLLANLVFCWLIIQNQLRTTFLAGLLGGFALGLHNPVPHATFALPWIIWMACKRREQLITLFIGYGIVALPLVIGWSSHLNTFDVKRYIMETVNEESSAKASLFSQVISRASFVIQPPSLELLVWRGAGVIKMIVWACPGLIVLAWCGWRLASQKNTSEQDPTELENKTYLRLLAASVLFTFTFYFFVRYDQGHGWGFRYLHHVWLAFPLLASYYMVQKSHLPLLGKIPFKSFIAIVALFSLLFLIPLQALQARMLMKNILQNEAGSAIMVQENSLRQLDKPSVSIVFISEKGGIRYSYLIQNDPYLRNRVWKFRFSDAKQSEQIARKYMKNAKLESREDWGEVWTGDSFNLPARS
jgi:hypothetical protein